MTHLILIDSRVPGIEDILSSLAPNTESLVFDYSVDTLEDLQSRIQKPYSSVAIAQHNYGLPYFNFLQSMGTCYVKDVATIDPELADWSDFIALLQWLKQNGASCVDFLACNLWESPDWVYAIEQLRSRLDLTIRASIDITGVDGNFILESDNFNMIGYYFTEEILKYKYNFYTSTMESAIGNINYTPIFFTASSPGYISATAYNSILGTGPTTPNVPLSADISNVLMACATRSAVAVLKTDGTVVAFGHRNYGGNTAPVASQLYNITKLIASTYVFTALRSDGRVFSWGGGGILPGQTDINSTTNGVDSVLLSDVSNSLVNVVDIFVSSTSSYALTASGTLLGWGSNECKFSRNALFTSGVVKVIAGPAWVSIFKNTGVVYYCSSNTIYDSSAGSTNRNPIVDVISYSETQLFYFRTTASNTTQVTDRLGNTVYYTIPEGVTVIQKGFASGNTVLVLLSNNVLLSLVNGGTFTSRTGVTDFAANDGAYAYLQNNVVSVVGNAGYGGSLTNATNGLPSGKDLTNVRRLVSSGRSLGALKFDNTFVWWGGLGSYNSVSFPTADPTLYAAISSNIASVYGNGRAYVFTKLDGSIIQVGTTNWCLEGVADQTTMYGAKRANKNVLFLADEMGFFAVENTPTTSYTISQPSQFVSTTFTYYNNNPDVMALRGRKYSLMVGTTVVGTWICPADSFTYTFANTIFTQSGSFTVSICDTPDLTTSYVVMGSVDVTGIAAAPTPSAPTISSVTAGNQSITVAFTKGADNGSVLGRYEYALVLNSVLGSYSIAPSISSPFTITGLTNGTSYQVALRQVSTIGSYSNASTYSSAVTPGAVPVAPVIASVQPGNGSITVSWVTPSTNGAPITSVLYNLSGGTYVSGTYVSAGTTNASFTITGLTNGTSYTVSVIVANSFGQSLASSVSSLVVPISVPSPPTVNSFTPGDSSVQIALTPGATNGSTFIAYKYTVDASNYTWVKDNASPITIYGLTNGSTYNISLKSVGQCVGDSTAVALSSSVIPYKAPNPPTITSVVAGNGSASLYFTDGSNNGRSITARQYTINGVTYADVTGASPLLITGLTNGTSYTATLKCLNLAGYSSSSLASSVFVPFTVPSAPTITNLDPSANKITVYLSPGSANGSAITRYSYSLNGGAYVNTADAALSFVISGLTNGTSYTVALKAENVAGVGAASSTSAAVTPFTVPNAPTITGVTVGNGSATVAITNGNNNGRTATQYQYTYTSSAGSTTLTTSSSDTQLSSILITGLTNWTNYTVTVKAINVAGISAASAASASFMPYTIPSAPVIASVVPGNASIVVNLDGTTIGNAVVGYKYSFDNSSYTYVSGAATSFTITGRTNGTSYQVYVKSVTSLGDSPASIPSSPVVPFAVPNAPTITSVVAGDRTVSIYVSDGSNNGRTVTSYEYSTDGVNYTSVSPVSPIVLNNLTNWVSRSYYVRTVNAAGNSLPSAQSSAVVPFLVPTSASIASIEPGFNQLTVNMDGYTSDSGIIGYKYSLDDGELVYVAGSSASFVITGLVNGQDYVVAAKSCTTAGESPLSSPYAPTHPSSPPDAPTNVVVTPVDESAVITFTDNSENGEPIQYYMYSLSGDVDTPIRKRPDGSLKVFGISNALSYAIRLRAVNNTGASPYSVVSSPFIPFGLPLVVPVITKVLPGNGCAYVYFSEADTNGSPLTKFKWSDGLKTYDLSGTTSPLTIPGLTNKKPCTISIASCNILGASPYTTPRTMIPGVPLAPVITSVVSGPKKLLVYFDVPEDNGFAISSYLYGFVGAPAFVKGTSASTTSVSPLQILNLKNGTPYNVQIMAGNANGNSIASNALGNRIPCEPPAKVSIATVTPLIDGALVAFTAPLPNGTPLLKYKYALGASTTYMDASGLTLPLRIYGIPPNTVNTIKIIATNEAGDSIESAPSKAFTYVYIPPAQIKVTALTIAMNQLTIAFLPPAPNGAPILKYRYALDASGVPGSFVDASGLTLPLIITEGVLNNVTYNVRVVAVNSAGTSVPSLPVAKPVSFMYLPPLPPVVSTVVSGFENAVVTFAGLPSRGPPITGYAYTLDASATTIYDISGAVSPITITGLSNNVVYNVRVAAITPVGYSAWSIAKPTTFVYLPPLAPTISVIASGDRSAVVTFTGSPARGAPITGYAYTLDASATTIYDVSGAVSPMTIPDLVNDTSYNVRVAAITPAGYSAWSVPKSVTPVYKAPDAPLITTVVAGKAQLTVTFTAPAANGSPITGYKYVLNGGSKVEIATIVQGKTFVITGLTNGTLYNVQMCATNILGDSALSALKPGTPKA